MKRFQITIIFCLALTIGGFIYTAPTIPPDCPQSTNAFIDTVFRSVCHIAVEGNWGTWEGSGSYIGNGLILTAGHIVQDANKFTVAFEDGTVCESYKYYLEPTSDVGFIYLGDYDGPKLDFNLDSVSTGDDVFCFGNPFGLAYSFSVSKGIISALNRDMGGWYGSKLLIQCDAAGFPGISGGPATDDEKGILGICVGGIPGGITLLIPARVCQQSMRTYLSILAMEKLK